MSFLVLTSITIVIIGMTSYELVLHYLMTSHHISCSLILSLLLICSPFYSNLLYFKLILYDSIRFDSIEVDLLYCSVLYLISMNDLCLSVRPFVCLFICMNKFLFSPLSLLYIFPLFLFSYEHLPHTHTRTRTRTRTHKYI